MKISILLLASIATVMQLTQSATLRRKPKIYNALITTDQNLTPSRAFPIIQPHLHETYAYPSYSYRSYSPLGLYNNGFQYGSATATSYNGFHGYPRLNTGLVQARNFYPRDEIHTTLPPISNDFGLPPSLVPINSFPFGNLAPYPYHSYPILYDQFGGYGGLLPPYSFYPPGFDAHNPDNANGDVTGKDDDEKNGGSDSKGNGNEPSVGNGNNSSGGNGNESSGGSGGGSPGGNDGSSAGGGRGNSGSSGGRNGSGGSSSGGSGSGGSSGGSGGSSSGGSGSGGSSSGGSGSGGSSGGSGGSFSSNSGGSSGSGSNSSTSTSSNTKSSRSRNFDKSEYPHQQSLNEDIKNFPNKDPSIPDINPSPPVRVKALNK